MKLPLIFTPRSGPSEKNPEALLARLSKETRARLEPTPFGPPWDFAPLIERAASAGGPLLMWGGDGTIHHTGRALVDFGCPVALAAVPGGSGNGLARGLRTPLDPAGAVEHLIQGRDLWMDLPRLDGVPFFNVCGTGFEGQLAKAFDEAPKGRGILNYARLGLHLWRSVQPLNLHWERAEREPSEPPRNATEKFRAAWRGPEPSLPEQAWSLTFANLPQYGSGLWIAPGADPLDGLLQWVALARPGLLDLPTQVLPFFREGGHTCLRQEGRLRRAEVRLDVPCPWHLDGEPVAARDHAELSLEPRAFRMRVTRACPW